MGDQSFEQLIGTAASVSSIGLLIAPGLICKNILKNKSAKYVPPFVFTQHIARCLLQVQQGLLLGATPLILTYGVGVFLGLIYIAIYAKYTENKDELKSSVGWWTLILGALFTYTYIEDKSVVELRYGTFMLIISAMMLGSQLMKAGDAIRQKSTKEIPFPIVFFGSITTALWFVYGRIIGKPIIQIQTGMAFIVFSGQLMLFFIYPAVDVKKKE
nr:SWEET sugar transporter [Nilaparvata lugens]